MRRLENYVRKYGPEFGPILYHALQSQAAHAGVSARLRRKIDDDFQFKLIQTVRGAGYRFGD
jgi:superfamily II helicase